jgi:hypothetical protein
MTETTAERAAEAAANEAQDSVDEQCAELSAHIPPLPGVMDFVGAHIGGELAEERWR